MSASENDRKVDDLANSLSDKQIESFKEAFREAFDREVPKGRERELAAYLLDLVGFVEKTKRGVGGNDAQDSEKDAGDREP